MAVTNLPEMIFPHPAQWNSSVDPCPWTPNLREGTVEDVAVMVGTLDLGEALGEGGATEKDIVGTSSLSPPPAPPEDDDVGSSSSGREMLGTPTDIDGVGAEGLFFGGEVVEEIEKEGMAEDGSESSYSSSGE